MDKVGLIVFSLLLAIPAFADKIQTYSGEAKKDGKLAYTEKHVVTFSDDGKLLNAETTYTDANGKKLAHLKSDFTMSVTSPNHDVENFVTGNVQGLRHEGDKIVLYNKEKDKPEETKTIEDKKTDDRILMGCQGLNYYMVDHLTDMKDKKSLGLRFLIPGLLDYYDFQMNYINEEANGDVHFEVEVDSWFIRLFAPKLYVTYNKNSKHLTYYKGISNITDENGKKQNVEIAYKYD